MADEQRNEDVCESCGCGNGNHHSTCKLARRGLAQRMADHNAVRRAGGSPRAAIRAYCAGNKWLEENARAVGNWED